MVRHGSAKAVFVGSIPTLASKISNLTREVVLKLNGAGQPGPIVEFQQPFSEIFSNLGVECSKGRIE